MRVGLTGGIGSGKSAVAALFAEFGAFIIDTDLLARDAVEPMSDAVLAIARVWPGVVRGGTLDRGALAEIIFADPAAREQLNAIVHPQVRRLAIEREQHARIGQMRVHVVPLLFETDYAKLVDRTVLVVAPEAERIARIIARDHTDEAHVRARMAAQIAVDVARELADYVIENNGDVAQLRTRAGSVYSALTVQAPNA